MNLTQELVFNGNVMVHEPVKGPLEISTIQDVQHHVQTEWDLVPQTYF